MRKNVKNKLLEIFETIYEAHKIVREFINQKQYNNTISVLGSCQDAIVHITEVVENSEGEEVVTIQFIQEYYTLTYELANTIDNHSDGEQVKKLLDSHLEKIENSIKKDIKTKLEVVFMPYKASMWDSLESVWKAADEDPDCDAYVIPIPYYDRNPDHSFGKYHYEGEEFPKYVPITYYKDYDLIKRKPDVIFIHNPYDDCNYVTSVDPRFYSSELKKYTDKLVYIPYFVVAHDNINPALFNATACIYADRVILQSKPLTDKYINLYSGILNISKHELKNKFIALGSPKFDAIVNANKNDYDIPDEWKKIINNKKIVMYNTSITTALNNTTLFLKKLLKTIDYFKNNNEYVLWWRPHPLLQSTFESMRSQFKIEYFKIISLYKSQKIGIYDESSNLQRSIIYSDVYYGDYKSSVIILYCATGKPIISAHIESDQYLTSFEQDMIEHFRDNSKLDILKRNENYDGTAGMHIYNYIKGEITT